MCQMIVLLFTGLLSWRLRFVMMFLLCLSGLLCGLLVMLVSRRGLRWFLGLLRRRTLVLGLMLSRGRLLCRSWFSWRLDGMLMSTSLSFRMLVFFSSAVFVPGSCRNGGLEFCSLFRSNRGQLP